MKYIKYIILGGIAVALAVLLYNPSVKNEAPKKVASVSLRLKWLYDPGFGGELYAKAAGIFAENGLAVEIRPGGFESDPIKLVASGSDTFGVAGADTFLIARSKGIPIVAFAAGYIESPVVFYSLATSNISKPQDFAGKRVGYQAGQDTATVYEALMKTVALDRNSVKEVPVKYDFSPLLSGAVDVWPGYAATQSYQLEKRKVSYRVVRPADYGIRMLGTVYFTTEDYMRRNPEIIRAFVKSLKEGWQKVYREGSDSPQVISGFDSTAMPVELVRFNLDKQADFIRPNAREYCEYEDQDWKATATILKDAGLIPKEMDVATAYTRVYFSH